MFVVILPASFIIFLAIFISNQEFFPIMPKPAETPAEHKKKHGKDVQELWNELEKRNKEHGQEDHDKEHADFEEEKDKEEE